MKPKKTKIYISGPMTGVPREVMMERFLHAEDRLRALGYKRVVNPTNVWVCRWPWLYKLVGYRLTLIYDLWLLSRCTHIFMLSGWGQSRGSVIEYENAMARGLEEEKRILL